MCFFHQGFSGVRSDLTDNAFEVSKQMGQSDLNVIKF